MHQLWKAPDPRTTCEPITDSLVGSVEASLGRRLPESYVALLRIQNGGYLRRKYHPLVNAEVDAIWGISATGHTALGKHDWSDVLRYMSEEKIVDPVGLAEMIPFYGDGHSFVCFDYGNTDERGEPPVVFVDVELFEPPVVVSRTFEQFINELQESP